MKVLVGLGIVGLIGVMFAMTALEYRSDCVKAEAGIVAQWEQNQNNYDNMWKRFKETSQVSSMYAEDLEKVFKGAIQARYGQEGSKAVFQFLREQNPNMDAKIYVNLQTIIEAGRVSFAADQTQLIDKKRAYEVILKGNRALLVGFVFKYPQIQLAKYEVVTSDVTAQAFETHQASEVKLR